LTSFDFWLNRKIKRVRRRAASRSARLRQTANETEYAAIPAHGFSFPFSKPCRDKTERKQKHGKQL
jgi:hypothetical protein